MGSANVGSMSALDRNVIDGTHPHITNRVELTASIGALTAGQLVAITGGKLVAARRNISLALGTGNGSLTTFTATAPAGDQPIRPGSVTVTATGGISLTDDGNGRIRGSGGSGTVEYDTGKISVTFAAAPASGAVAATFAPALVGVLADDVNTAAGDTHGSVIVHGTVVKAQLLTGNVAANAAEIAALRTIGVYPL